MAWVKSPHGKLGDENKKDIQYEAQPDAEADPLETDRKKIGARKGVALEVTASRMEE